MPGIMIEQSMAYVRTDNCFCYRRVRRRAVEDPGSLFSYIILGTPVPISTGNGEPSHENGDPQCNTHLDRWTA